jgi:hypothetical protein
VINIGDPDGTPRLVCQIRHDTPHSVTDVHYRLLACDALKVMNGTQVYTISPSTSNLLTTPTEIFLPSYMECDFESIERKRDPVHEINLSDEEVKNMFPQ